MKSAAHAIYWKLHSAFLRNERQKADLLLGMLEDESKRVMLRDEIGAPHHARFLLIKDAIKSGTYARLYGSGSETPDVEGLTQSEYEGDEAEFHRKLMRSDARKLLFDCLGIDQSANYVHEVEMGPYGRCDFVIREGRIWHCVEVKMREAKHSVVSQIDKYRLAMELDMCMGLHDRVNAIVVAQSFSPYVATELSRLSVLMVKHDGTVESLRRISDG